MRIRGKIGRLCACAAAVAAIGSLPASAAPIVTLTNLLVNGSTGSFEAHLSNAGGSDQIGGYTVSFRVSPETGATGDLSLTSSVQPSITPTFNDAGQNPSLGSGQTDFHTANDIYNTNPPGFITGGDNTNLVHFNFTLPGGTTGKFDVTLLSTPSGGVPASGLFNGTGQTVAATFSSTPLVVNTPEPTSLVSLIAAASLLARRRRHRDPIR